MLSVCIVELQVAASSIKMLFCTAVLCGEFISSATINRTWIFMSIARYLYPILMKFGFS